MFFDVLDVFYINPHFDHTGLGFDGLDPSKMAGAFRWSNFHEFTSMEMQFRDETLFKIRLCYIKHQLDHTGPGFDHAIQ